MVTYRLFVKECSVAMVTYRLVVKECCVMTDTLYPVV